MTSHRKTATIVGILFIIATVVLIVSGFFSESITTPEYLTSVAANENSVITGALLEIISAAAVIGIPIALFPILKKYNEGLALGYVGARFFEGLFLVISTVILLLLVSLSQEFVNGATASAASLQTAGTLLLSAREWCSILLDFPFTIGALILNYIFYRSALVPRWLSIWGIIGAALWLAIALLHLFGFNPPMIEILALPIAAQEMALAVWLIVKGFNQTVMKS
ncbi:MAG: DUF4386 domain-containing protein [Candidatus Bathyarchaeia archaeon]|jgi:hypothetical protein